MNKQKNAGRTSKYFFGVLMKQTLLLLVFLFGMSSAASAAEKTWDFSNGFNGWGTTTLTWTWSSAHKCYSPASALTAYTSLYLSGGTTELAETAGLQFNGSVSLYKTNVRVNAGGSIKIPVSKGQNLKISSNCSAAASMSIDNVTTTAGEDITAFSPNLTTYTDNEFLVKANGYVTITNTSSSNYVGIQTITLTNTVPALEFTSSPDSTINNTQYSFSNPIINPTEVTVTYAASGTSGMTFAIDSNTGILRDLSGTGDITVTATSAAADGYNVATATYTLHVVAANADEHTWNFSYGFTNFGNSSALTWDYSSTNRCYTNSSTTTDYASLYLNNTTTELAETAGLLFKGSVSLYNNFVRVFQNGSIEIPVKKGQILAISCRTVKYQSIAITNVKDQRGNDVTTFYPTVSKSDFNTNNFWVASNGYVTLTYSDVNRFEIQSITLMDADPVLEFENGSNVTIKSTTTTSYSNPLVASTVPAGSTVTYSATTSTTGLTFTINSNTGAISGISGNGDITVTAATTAVDGYNAATATYNLHIVSFAFDNEAPSIANGTTTYTQTISDAGTYTYSIVSKSDGITAAIIDATSGTISGIAGNGIIRVRATNSTQAYAEYVLTVAYATHVWDFYSAKLTFGAKANGGVNDAIADAANGTATNNDYWGLTYEMTKNGVNNRPVYEYKKPVNGDNGLVVGETIGLQFNCAASHFGVCNGDANKTRFVAIEGSYTKVAIPKLKQGQYIKIQWDPYSSGSNANPSGATFTATNVNDLNDYGVEKTFYINGILNSWTNVPKGYTIFHVKADGDVSFTLTDSGWNDLISIEVTNDYSSGMVFLMGGNIVSTANNNTSVVHKKGESATVSFDKASNAVRSERGKNTIFNVVQQLGATGSFKDNVLTAGGTGLLKIYEEIQTPADEDVNGNTYYILDRQYLWLAVGEYTQQTYPYTWDFSSYNMGGYSKATTGKSSYANNLGTSVADYYGSWARCSGGDYNYGLNTYSLSGNDALPNTVDGKAMMLDKTLFAQGSQLCYGTKVLRETEGLRVSLKATSTTADHVVQIDGSALKFGSAVGGTLTIPAVDNDMYVFVNASTEPTVTIGGTAATKITNSIYALNSKVYLYKNTSGASADVTITTDGGINIYKIGVTNINKNINKDGKTTESRDRAIDYSQSGVFTQNSLQPYYISSTTDFNNTTDKITTTKVSVVPANTGLVLYNKPVVTPTSAVDVPLFVPAVNIATETVSSSSPLKPCVSKTYLSGSNDDTYQYIYTNKYYQKGNSTLQTGAYGFYRVNADEAGYLAANKAYLELPASLLSAQAKSMVFLNFDDDSATGIANPASVVSESTEDGVYYNLNGLRLDGKPSQKGIYILNGKKVLIK